MKVTLFVSLRIFGLICVGTQIFLTFETIEIRKMNNLETMTFITYAA